MSDTLTDDLASLKIDRSPVRRSRKFPAGFAVGAVVLAILGAGAIALKPQLEARVFKVEVTLSTVIEVTPSQESALLTASGYVIPQSVSKVGAKTIGRVAKVTIKEGDKVAAGQVIAELEDSDLRTSLSTASARVQSAKARAEAARANLAEVEIQLERSKALVAKGAQSTSVFDDLQAREASLKQALRATEAEVQAVQAESGPLGAALRDRTIHAPIAGTVISKPIEVGESVDPATRFIAEIADLDSQLVEVDVPEGRLHMVTPSLPAEISLDAYPQKRFRGRVVEVGRKVNRAKASVVVKVKFEESLEGVLPEMSARVNFLTKEVTTEALNAPRKRVVPRDAVVSRAGSSVVFVVENGIATAAPVVLGEAMGSNVELVDGPRSGARIVVKPPEELSTGARIKEKGQS